ncbi:MAG: hypothetical protein BMS9Abin07_1829 [Acidimicrobiia bacterium]|nr:MAG: hypothetical protein BMS9Abin07_1829 [Acidimicrobiia bacterium]
MMSELPTYVPRLGHGEVALMPPGVIERATVVMFAAGVDESSLQAYVDLVLTDRGGPTYHVASPTILFCFLDSPRLTSSRQPIGFVGDHEVAVWVPLVERNGSELRFVVWMPYIWVDTDIAMATGREVWGFPKTIGAYDPPSGKGAPHVLSTRIFRTFDPETEGEEAELIRIDPASEPGASVWKDFEEAARGIGRALGVEGTKKHFSFGDDLRLAVDLVEIAVSRKIPVVNLKQFRDAVDGTKACYQAIIDSNLELTGFHGGGPLLGDHRVTITPCASHQLIEDLGLPGPSFTARAGAWVTMDFLANPGTPVWSATDR